MSPRHIGLLAALASVWGGSYLLIKYALEGFEPAVIVWIRCVLAAVALYAVMRLRGGGAEARAAGAELRARPGRAVLLAPASLFVAAFAPFIDVTEKVRSSALGGMFMGLAGVALLVGVESVHSLGEFLGSLAMIGAAACYALSSFVVKRYKGLTSVTTSWLSITVASVLTLPAAIATAPSEVPGTRALLAVAVLGVVGTALAFVIFYKLIAETGAGRASLVSYLAPGIALFYGALLLDEPITAASIGGLALILGGVALASRKPKPAGDPVAVPAAQAASSAT